ncbi:MAG: PhoPQ-activated pathogenicity [Pedosphaera sp.]|nr:PhoPQ-activated pathogenicity [Pedosphaera sp.]
MFIAAIAALWTVSLPGQARAAASPETALDRYIAKPDPAYAYRLANTIKGEGFTTFVIDMTSQTWLTTNEVDRPTWKHWVTIVKPDSVTSTKALLFITGGTNDRPAPKGVDENISRTALGTKSIVAELRMVPNQALVFKGETNGRTEDSLIAYTWDKYLRTGDEKWPARLPMTKSAVRAMDTITSFCASDEGGKIKVEKFMVAGGSKRGWTTWTTAAVDKRVEAIAPIVIDMLNVIPSFKHHYAAYGFWAPAVGDYTAMHIMDWTDTPEYAALLKIEEPYEYRDRLTMPKFIINAAGDQFFLPDSSQFYFDQLKGTKYLRYVPNADHGLKGSDAWMTLLACYHAVLNKAALPEFTWTSEKNGTLRVKAGTQPTAVKLWQATNPDARDFRLMTIGPAWTSKDVPVGDKGTYLATVSKPEKGWTAYFAELTFPSTGPAPFKFTTSVQVIPDVLPFKYEPPAEKPKGFLSR